MNEGVVAVVVTVDSNRCGLWAACGCMTTCGIASGGCIVMSDTVTVTGDALLGKTCATTYSRS